MKTLSAKNKCLIASLVIYGISFSQKAFTVSDFDGRKSTSGYEAFLMGALSFLGGGFLEWIVWLANPLYFLSIILKNKKPGVVVSRIAVFIAATFTTWSHILAAENGRIADIEAKGVGYFLWLTSMIIWAIGIKTEANKDIPEN